VSEPESTRYQPTGGETVKVLVAGVALSLAATAAATLLPGKSPFEDQARELAHVLGWDGHSAILGPFTDLAHRTVEALYGAVLPAARSSLHWPFLILTLFIALALFVLRGGRGAKGADGRERVSVLREYLLPKAIYTHPSARVDIGLYLIDRALMPLWTLAFLGALAPWTERTVIGVLQWSFGAGPALAINIGWKLAYGLVTLLCVDACFFFYHLMMHRTRLGWAIHKVHHSAEVLTPLTRSREHFLEAPIEAGFTGFGFALAAGIFSYLFAGGITEITVMNVGIFFFLYTINGNFRHYHVSLRYPRWLEHWLQSPGMHHTHHSILKQHWDSNLGLVTSIWDRMFGTLYIAELDEATPWGLSPEDQGECRTLSQNLWAPFREMGDMAREILGRGVRLDTAPDAVARRAERLSQR
jgi:sterol desaturase/sphingolipid hydroxylase (fatty acid hydroxylase superfamily)